MSEAEEKFDLEKAFHRLETILERMNSGKASLDESLMLYEEADGLIGSCRNKLQTAQAKVDLLIKKRSGELDLDEEGRVRSQEFVPQG